MPNLDSRRMNISTKITTAKYFVWDTDKTVHGPVEFTALVAWVKNGRVVASTWVFACVGGIWERAEKLPELRSFFQVRRLNVAGHASPIHSAPAIELGTLRRNRLLSYLTDEQLERFAQFVVVERFPQAAVIVKQGDHSKAMYLILEGELSVQLLFADQQTELATLGAGDFFGDFALFDHGPRSADVVANQSCLLLKISADAFQELSRVAPDLATPFLRAIGSTLTTRIRAGNKHQGEAVLMTQVL